MTLHIPSSNIVIRPTVRSVSPAEISPVQTNAATKEERTSSINEILNKRMQTMRKASRDMLSKLNTVSESRKAAARQRLELAKERIKMLKMLVSSGLASKGVLREIRALAQELGQAAKELSGDSPAAATAESSDTAQTTQDGDTQQPEAAGQELSVSDTLAETKHKTEHQEELKADSATEAEAPTESANDAEVQQQARAAQHEVSALGTYLHHQNNINANQRRQDAESIKEVLSMLKSLVEMVKNMDLNDPESRKELEKINGLLSKTENIATDMAGGTIGGLSLGNIVSVNV